MLHLELKINKTIFRKLTVSVERKVEKLQICLKLHLAKSITTLIFTCSSI